MHLIVDLLFIKILTCIYSMLWSSLIHPQLCSFSLASNTYHPSHISIHAACWSTNWFCWFTGLVWVTGTAVSSWAWQPCHVQKSELPSFLPILQLPHSFSALFWHLPCAWVGLIQMLHLGLSILWSFNLSALRSNLTALTAACSTMSFSGQSWERC